MGPVTAFGCNMLDTSVELLDIKILFKIYIRAIASGSGQSSFCWSSYVVAIDLR